MYKISCFDANTVGKTAGFVRHSLTYLPPERTFSMYAFVGMPGPLELMIILGTLVFLVAPLILVVVLLRRSSSSAPPPTPPCPQCGGWTPPQARFCPWCATGLQDPGGSGHTG